MKRKRKTHTCTSAGVTRVKMLKNNWTSVSVYENAMRSTNLFFLPFFSFLQTTAVASNGNIKKYFHLQFLLHASSLWEMKIVRKWWGAKKLGSWNAFLLPFFYKRTYSYVEQPKYYWKREKKVKWTKKFKYVPCDLWCFGLNVNCSENFLRRKFSWHRFYLF